MSTHTPPRRQTADVPQSFEDWLRSLDFLSFCQLHGTMWSASVGKYLPWELWKGVSRPPREPKPDGVYPGSFVLNGVEHFMGQPEMLQTMAESTITWLSKARQMGGSEGAAMYALYLCLTKPKTLVMVFSKDRTAAEAFLSDRVVRKMEGLILRPDPSGEPYPWASLYGGLPWVADSDGKPGIRRIEFKNGSVIEAHSSDNSGAISRTPRLVIFDEIKTFAFDDAKEMWANMLGALNYPMQVIAISTAEAGSWYNETTRVVMEGKMPGAKFVFIPDDTNPAHDAEFRKKRLGQLLNDETLLARDCPLIPEDMFASHDGLVIGSWDPKVHVGTRDITWDDEEELILAYDHGYRHPSVCGFYQYNRYTNLLYRFDEVFEREKELTYVGPLIKKKLEFWQEKWKKRLRGRPAPHPYCLADTAIFSETGVRPIVEVLEQETGLSWSKAHKHDEKQSLDLMQARFFYRNILIDPRCVGAIQQVSGWRYIEKKDKPADIENDFQDECRYTCSHISSGIRPVPPDPLTVRLRQVAERRAREAATVGLQQPYGQPGGMETWQGTL